MSEDKAGPDAAPFLAAVLAVNGVLCILGALSFRHFPLSIHSSALMAALAASPETRHVGEALQYRVLDRRP